MIETQFEPNNLAVFENVKKYLRNIFIWPENGEKFSWKFFWKIALIIFLFFTPTFVGLLGHIYMSWKRHLISDLINDFVFVLLSLNYLSCALFYMVCCKKLEHIICNINNTEYGNPEHFTKLTKRMEFLTTFIHHYVLCICWSYVVLFLFWDSNCESRKMDEREEMFGYVCGVPTPAWFRINLDIFPWKHFLICCNIYLGFILPNGATLGILFYGFIVFTVDRIDHLISILDEVNPRIEELKAKEKMILCVKFYAGISMLVNDINDTIGLIYAPSQNGLVSLSMALLEYQALMEKSALPLLPLSTWLFLQAVACNCGQALEDASSRLRNRVYEMPWYQMSVSFQKDFKIFHAQVQRGFRLKLKPSIRMNMEYYCQFMNGSYSILMFLINLERKNME